MASRKRPETRKTPEVVVRRKSKRNRSPRELEPEAKKLCVKGPGSSRRFDSGCLWAGLASLQVSPPCRNIVRALYHHKVGKAAWPSLQQIGAGGSITGLKFNPLNTNQFFTSSMEGMTRLQDFKGNTLQVFASYSICNFWFCSLDVSAKSRVVVTGDNVGNVILLNMDGKELWNLRMHKKKVTHLALNPCCDWFLATASVDQTVKIWDLRQVKGKSSFLYSLPHRHPVNAAHFSPDGAQLLTTDQNSEIRVYSASQWDCPPSLIPHPHRHFQHLTPIKAAWHPRYNFIVVGRYPDPNFKSCTPYELRTIDVFDGSSGKLMHQLYDPESSGIISLNEFNPMGDTLASLMGYHILIWSQEEAGMQK
ncbi:DNA damage-binding protein 2 isoform X2 [Pteropus medius]|uniref:DNA damage-binding protein 2 n=1 Tax=Pteropus vampyrus TaxID=132908 RepID=A0A6P6CAV9_PTEVA|nr:DNA damage-binding protein 2 isoform X2 [Pteropus vampyrus]XP_039724856.1 DNA damage-binding protein 2 isoform X2 [Pteropus giganteus]